MGAIAGRVFLDADPVGDDFPIAAEPVGRALAIGFALGRHRAQKSLAMLERVGRRGKADLGEPRRDYPGMRRPAGVERFGHRAEIGHDAAAVRGRERQGMGGARRIETAQQGASRRRADRAENAGRMPALAVMVAGIACGELGPGFVAGDIGREHVAARGAERLALGEDRRHHHGARMAAQRGDIVVIERMPGGAVDPCRLRRRRALAGEIQCRLAAGGRQRAAQQLGCRVLRPGDHRGDAIGKADARHLDRLGRQPLERKLRDKAAEILGQRHLRSSDSCADRRHYDPVRGSRLSHDRGTTEEGIVRLPVLGDVGV